MIRRAIVLGGMWVAVAIAFAGLLGSGEVGATSRDAAGTHVIQMKSVSFAPRTLTIQLGDTVVWRNTDIVRHNAVFADQFQSEDLRTGESFTWVPADTGLIRYRCTIHQRMRGEIRVGR